MVADLAPSEADAKEDENDRGRLEARELGLDALGSSMFEQHSSGRKAAPRKEKQPSSRRGERRTGRGRGERERSASGRGSERDGLFPTAV